MNRYLCFDIGGNSGRAIVASFDGNKIELEEINRFISAPVRMTNGYYYDVLSTLTGIKDSIVLAKSKYPELESMGIDAFGVDFGLLSKTRELIANPMCDCDTRMFGMVDYIKSQHDLADVYSRTGSRIDESNTFFQLLALKKQDNPILHMADKLLMYPDLLNYFLTGEMITEFSVGTTSAMINAKSGIWDMDIVRKFGLPDHIFTNVVVSGDKLAPLSKSVRNELLIDNIDVVTIAEHDTASAVVPILADEADYIFISSGTWSVIGTKTDKPVINPKYANELSNEGCYDGTNRLIKNVFGLKFLQECQTAWHYAGIDIGYAQMGRMSEGCEEFRCFIEPEDAESFSGTNMPKLIKEYCKKTNQTPPEEIGEFVRCVNESLAFSYKRVIETIEDATGKSYEKIYIVGGGMQNTQLCQMAANATQKVVVTGNKESAALGNSLVQAMAAGEISSKSQMVDCIKASSPMKTYQPENIDLWQRQFEKFCDIVK